MKTKIAILGIGGVGGYYGGLLAHYYRQNPTVEINFIARGANLKAIQEHGLKVVDGDKEFIARPAKITDKPASIGVVDYIIVCTKNYDLESAIESLNPCIDNHTVLLPLLNGIDGVEKIKKILPNNIVAQGCTYIVAALKEPGIVANLGNVQRLFFGIENVKSERLTTLENLLRKAGVDAVLSDNINVLVWEKFILIAAMATSTSYFNTTMGDVVQNHKTELYSLIEEVTQLAVKKQIAVNAEIVEKTFHKMASLPYENTSSMHRDLLQKKSNTEIEALTGYVVHTAKQVGLETPTYKKMYEDMKKR